MSYSPQIGHGFTLCSLKDLLEVLALIASRKIPFELFFSKQRLLAEKREDYGYSPMGNFHENPEQQNAQKISA